VRRGLNDSCDVSCGDSACAATALVGGLPASDPTSASGRSAWPSSFMGASGTDAWRAACPCRGRTAHSGSRSSEL